MLAVLTLVGDSGVHGFWCVTFQLDSGGSGGVAACLIYTYILDSYGSEHFSWLITP